MSKGFRKEKYLSHLRKIDPYEFQEFVAELWELQDYETTIIRDEGIHIIAERDEGVMKQGVAIQTRRLSEGYKVDSADIAQFIDARLHDAVESVVVVTTTDFTEEAVERANREGMKLVNGEKLEELVIELDASDLVYKYEGEKETKPAPAISDLPATDTLKQVMAATGAWMVTFVTALVLPFVLPDLASILFIIGFGAGLLAWFAIPVTLNRDARNLNAQKAGYRPSPTLWAMLGLIGAGVTSVYYLYRRFTRA
ncbi:restriction endonuclease [Natrarchaeobius oligotrophus]|uniref:Restriction endonuclease n=1 Tax=Natrarchaeobius chitinivorans TaxID=1679083 RepID=A0A3N6MHB5_NATCH|nr:restriction endonuclease [Natrarchaeobius chitinivorans]RQH03429.1 restriction endonuclease [Natrarchaeobius chitinivorans]